MKRTLRVVLVLLGLPIALVCLAAAGFLVWEVATGGNLEIKEPPLQHPLAKMRVTQYRGKTDEIFVTLAPGVDLKDVLDLGLFEGFDSQMTLDAAKKDLGGPAGEWDDPFCRKPTPFYDRPQGRVSLCRYALEVGHRWDTIGYPRQSDHGSVFRDQRLPQQLAPWLLQTDGVNVHVRVEGSSGSVTVRMTRRTCAWIVLSERD